MVKKDIKKALGKSLKAEEDSVASRFEKADSIFTNTEKSVVEPIVKKSKKVKVIRDSFTMPASDHALIETIKSKCLKKGFLINKSEVVRAGFHALNRLSVDEIREIMVSLEKVKTGRPSRKG